MGKQEFCCVQCCQCKTFQSTLTKKSKKFTCAICNQTQSVLKTFAVSNNAKDIRGVVMQLNMARGKQDEVQAELVTEAPAPAQEVPACEHTKPSVDWQQYVEPEDELPQEDAYAMGSDGYVTSLPEPERFAKKRKIQKEMSYQEEPRRRASKQTSAVATQRLDTGTWSAQRRLQNNAQQPQQHQQRSTFLWGEVPGNSTVWGSNSTDDINSSYARQMPPPKPSAQVPPQRNTSYSQHQQRTPFQPSNTPSSSSLISRGISNPGAGMMQPQQQCSRPGQFHQQHTQSITQQASKSEWAEFLDDDDDDDDDAPEEDAPSGSLKQGQQQYVSMGGNQGASDAGGWGSAGGSSWGMGSGGDGASGHWDDACFVTGL